MRGRLALPRRDCLHRPRVTLATGLRPFRQDSIIVSENRREGRLIEPWLQYTCFAVDLEPKLAQQFDVIVNIGIFCGEKFVAVKDRIRARKKTERLSFPPKCESGQPLVARALWAKQHG